MSVSSAVGSASEACLTTQMHSEVAASLTARVLAAFSLWRRSLHCPALAAEHWASSLGLHIRKLQLQCTILLLMYRETRRPRASLRSWRSSRVRALHSWSLPILQLPACSATQNVRLCNFLGYECISLLTRWVFTVETFGAQWTMQSSIWARKRRRRKRRSSWTMR